MYSQKSREGPIDAATNRTYRKQGGVMSVTDRSAFKFPSIVTLAGEQIHPYYALLVGLLPGLMLIGGSILLDISTCTALPPKQAAVSREVGYLAAPNWSVTYAILFPVVLYLMSSSVRGLLRSLKLLHERGMVRTKDMRMSNNFVLACLWQQGSEIRKYVLLIFAVSIPLYIALHEWYNNNFLRIFNKASASSFSDYDWGLAAIMSSPEWSFPRKLASAAFDLISFSTEAMLIISLMAFFIAMLDLGRVVPSAMHDSEFMLLPDLRFDKRINSEKEDKRFGFEEFEQPLESLLGVALVAFLICYLVRLQGAYMASNNASSLLDFVGKDILSGVANGLSEKSFSGVADAIGSLFALNFQIRGDIAWLMAVLIAVFSLTTVVVTVREAARCAKENALRGLHNGSLTVEGYETAIALDKVGEMAIWPLGYLRLDLLLLSTFVAVFTLLFYRLGLLMALLVSLSLVARLMNRLVRPSRSLQEVTQQRPIIQIKGMFVKTDKSTSVNITPGRDAIIPGNITIAKTITDSFITELKAADASEDLKNQLVSLNTAVAEMCTHLQESNARKVQVDIDTLNKQAVSREPDKDYFELSAKRIRTVAETLGAVAEPVVTALKAVSGLLGISLP